MKQPGIISRSTSIFASVIVGLFIAVAFIQTVVTDLTTGLFTGAVVTIPAAVIGWFVLSLVLYCRAKKRGDIDLPERKSRMKVATALLLFLVAVILALIVFFAMAVSHM